MTTEYQPVEEWLCEADLTYRSFVQAWRWLRLDDHLRRKIEAMAYSEGSTPSCAIDQLLREALAARSGGAA